MPKSVTKGAVPPQKRVVVSSVWWQNEQKGSTSSSSDWHQIVLTRRQMIVRSVAFVAKVDHVVHSNITDWILASNMYEKVEK